MKVNKLGIILLILKFNLITPHSTHEITNSDYKPKGFFDTIVDILKRTDLKERPDVSKAKISLDKLIKLTKIPPGLGQKSNRKLNPDITSDINKTTPEFIVSRGFQSQEHTVVTDDGYILGTFRIINPYMSQKNMLKPVLLWHQLMANSNLWLISSPGSLDSRGRYSEQNGKLLNNCRDKLTSNIAYTLAACGYDVWLGNSRGTRYSPNHINFTSNSAEFNNYTFTELGIYDLKNTVEYIMKNTSESSIGYIGSSKGSTILFTLLSLDPTFEKYLNPIITQPTIAFLGNTTTTLRLATPLVPILNDQIFGLATASLDDAISFGQQCANQIIGPICALIDQTFIGGLPSYLTDTSTYVLLSSAATGGNYESSRILLQYGQFVLNGRFNQFDFMDPELNSRFYGQNNAPDYPLANITSKNLVFFRGPNDALGRKGDLDHLISSLTVRPKDVYLIKHHLFNHFDFPLSKFNNRLINWRILHHLSDSV